MSSAQTHTRVAILKLDRYRLLQLEYYHSTVTLRRTSTSLRLGSPQHLQQYAVLAALAPMWVLRPMLLDAKFDQFFLAHVSILPMPPQATTKGQAARYRCTRARAAVRIVIERGEQGAPCAQEPEHLLRRNSGTPSAGIAAAATIAAGTLLHSMQVRVLRGYRPPRPPWQRNAPIATKQLASRLAGDSRARANLNAHAPLSSKR